MFNPIKKYFNSVKKEEISIENIIDTLNNEKEIIERDNITLEIEIKRINEIITELQNEYAYGENLQSEVNNFIKTEKDEAKINYYNKTLLTNLEKKMFDIKQMIIVKQQSVMALQIIIKNNKEIIRNIEKVNNVTISALNTTVLVAKTLYNQKLVLNRINNIENNIGKINTGFEKNINEINNSTDGQLLLKEAFQNAIDIFDNVEIENKRAFPENEKKIMELKMGE